MSYLLSFQSCINAHAAKFTASETQGLAITTLFAKVMEVSIKESVVNIKLLNNVFIKK